MMLFALIAEENSMSKSHRKRQILSLVLVATLAGMAEVEQAVGAEGVVVPHPWLRIVPKDPPRLTEE